MMPISSANAASQIATILPRMCSILHSSFLFHHYGSRVSNKVPVMVTLLDQLLSAIDKDDVKTASRIIASGIELNVPCTELDGGPTPTLAACYS